MTDLAQNIAELRREVERLKAREAIRQALARYGRGQEWLDATLLDEVFWDDCAIDFGFFKGDWRAYRPVLMEIEARAEATYHFLGAAQIALVGEDRAEVECYGLAGGQSADATQIYGGRYLFGFALRDGVWKASRCTYVLDWTLKQASDGGPSEALAGINRVKGRSPKHPLFRRLGETETV